MNKTLTFNASFLLLVLGCGNFRFRTGFSQTFCGVEGGGGGGGIITSMNDSTSCWIYCVEGCASVHSDGSSTGATASRKSVKREDIVEV